MQTTYKKRIYRSRLEARWAAFFDLLGFEYDYEPAVDLDGWIPDFIIHGPATLHPFRQMSFFVEVKPYLHLSEFFDVRQKVDASLRTSHLKRIPILFLGISPWRTKGIAARGLQDPGFLGWVYGTGIRDQGKRITKYTIMEEVFLYEGNFHMQYDIQDKRNFFGWSMDGRGERVSFTILQEFWNQAGNAVQWKRSTQHSLISK